MKKYIILLMLAHQLTACSVQSNQYNFIKSLISENKNYIGPEKNWTASWTDQKFDVYAINIGNQILYTGSGANIFFKNKQIYKVTGLFPNDSVLGIQFNNPNLEYFLNNKRISSDLCQNLKTVSVEVQSEKHSQICFGEKTGETYENQIITNSDDLITFLEFKLHPNYPSLKLSIK